jgi:endonuclease/exonuclease/phosphatase (EEP) superfamily protein YafD
MRFWKILCAATGAEASFAAAFLGLASVAGRWNGWLDIIAQFAPFWFALALLGAALALVAIDRGLPRTSILALAAAGAITNGALIAPDFAEGLWGALAPTPRAASSLKVLTFNVWERNIDPDRTVDLILRSNADVIALQEVNGIAGTPRGRLDAAYPYRAGCPGGCHIEILSRRPIRGAGSSVFAIGKQFLAVVWAGTTMSDGEAVTIATTHYAWPIPPQTQREERRVLLGLLRRFDLRQLILTGDFNLVPWSRGMAEQDAALSPLRRRTHALFTWPANVPIIDKPAPFPLLAIDQVYAGPLWRTLAVRRLARGGAAHYGVLVVLTQGALASPAVDRH